MRIFLRYWLPLLAHMGLIFFLSSRSQFPVEMPPWAYHADKCVHAVLFGFLGFLFLRAWVQGEYGQATLYTAAFTIVFTVFYGIADEFHQKFVPGRTPDVSDVIADATGVILVCVFVIFMNTFWRKPVVD